MTILRILLVLLIGFPTFTNATTISSQHMKPLTIRIMSDDNGVITEEKMCCTRQTCCFSENYYCAMADGRCFCDLSMLPQRSSQKEYWMEITGFLSRIYCEKPQLLHRLTTIGLCDKMQCPFNGKNSTTSCYGTYLPLR